MINGISDMSPRKAARIAGIALMGMFLLAILVDDIVLSNLIVPGGDTGELARDIEASEMRFGIAVAGYLMILALDVVIALALYVILRAANRNLASLTAALRVLYSGILAVSLLALVSQFIDVYGYGTTKLVGYVFFIAHLFVLGYAVFKSGYIPRSLGVLLIAGSLCYIVAFYADFLVPEVLLAILAAPMIIAELSLAIWLLVKGAKIPEMKNQMNETTVGAGPLR